MPPRAPSRFECKDSLSDVTQERKSNAVARCGENNIPVCMEGLEKIKLKQSMSEGEEKMCESGYSMVGKP